MKRRLGWMDQFSRCESAIAKVAHPNHRERRRLDFPRGCVRPPGPRLVLTDRPAVS